MKDRDGKKIEPITKEQIDKLLKTNGIELKHDNGYDCVYVANMARADYWGSSIADEQHLALFVGDFIDDEDAYRAALHTIFRRPDRVGNKCSVGRCPVTESNPERGSTDRM